MTNTGLPITVRVAEPTVLPAINAVPEEFIARMDPVLLEYYNKYSVGRLGNDQVPMDEYRKNPAKYTISYGRIISDASVKSKDLSVPVDGGSITVRMYEPATNQSSTKGPRPAYINYHGGGWVLGGLQSDGEICKEVCDKVNCVVFDVDYRLAPEFPYPIPVEDSWTAFKWILENANNLNIDLNKIAIGGISAGAHICAVIAQRARDEGIKLVLQFLTVPVLDARIMDKDGFKLVDDCPYESYRENYNVPFLGFEKMSWFYRHFLGSPIPKIYYNDPSVSPIITKNLKGLANAVILTAELDILRDEGELYAKLLKENGVKVFHKRFDKVVHPFPHMIGILDASKEYLHILFDELKKAFE